MILFKNEKPLKFESEALTKDLVISFIEEHTIPSKKTITEELIWENLKENNLPVILFYGESDSEDGKIFYETKNNFEFLTFVHFTNSTLADTFLFSEDRRVGMIVDGEIQFYDEEKIDSEKIGQFVIENSKFAVFEGKENVLDMVFSEYFEFYDLVFIFYLKTESEIQPVITELKEFLNPGNFSHKIGMVYITDKTSGDDDFKNYFGVKGNIEKSNVTSILKFRESFMISRIQRNFDSLMR